MKQSKALPREYTLLCSAPNSPSLCFLCPHHCTHHHPKPKPSLSLSLSLSLHKAKDFASDYALTIALCFLVPFSLCFLWPLIVAALCQTRDAHVGKRKGFYEFKATVDEASGGPREERLGFEEIGDEGFYEEEVLSGVRVGCVDEEERFDGFGDVVKVFDEGFGSCEFGFGEKNVEEEEEGCVDCGVEDLNEESCVRDEVGVSLMEDSVGDDGFDGRGVGVCGRVDYLDDESLERDENGGEDRVGDVSLNVMNVEEESFMGDGGVCEGGESLVDESSKKCEFDEVETRNEVGVVCLPEKNVEEECLACEGVIYDIKDNLIDDSSERHEVGETAFDLASNQEGARESEEIDVSKCVRKDETDEATNNVVDSEANEEELYDEDNDWEDIERTELERLFGAAVVFFGSKSNADRVSSIGNDVKMRLDGLHRIATRGPCLEPQPMAFKVSARAKWIAWQQLGNMSAEVAMEQYIADLSESIPGWTQDVNNDFPDSQGHKSDKTVTAGLNKVTQNQSEVACVSEVPTKV